MSRIRALVKDAAEAVKGSNQDFTEGSLSRALFLLSLPMVLEMVMEAVFAVVDIYFVSRLGPDAVATVGITESLMTVVYAIGIGFGTATTALVARRTGEKNKQAAAVAAGQSVLIGVLIGIVLAVPGLFFARDLLRLMGANDSMIESNWMYTAIIISTNIVVVLLFIINAVFRSTGDAAISMRVLWLANLANMVLDPILIFGFGPIPAMGIQGAAIASVIGRGIAVLYQISILVRGTRRIRIGVAEFSPALQVIKTLVRLSYGGIGQHLISTSSWIFLMRILAEFGSVVLAGYTIALRILIFSILPSWGLSNAAATLVGQNLGAGKPARAEQSVYRTTVTNMILLGIIALVFIAWADYFIRLFIDEPDVVRHGSTALRIMSFGYLSYAVGMVMPQAFNGAGDTTTPTVLNFISFWLLEIPLAYMLSISLGFKESGVYYAIVCSESLLALLGFLLFKRGSWKKKSI
jgi:putative MATE family efflux protein